MTDIQRLVLRFNALGQELQAHASAMTEDEPSNCLLRALRQRALFGGEIVFVPSAYGPWEHVLWRSPAGELWEYDPVEPKFRQSIAPTLFVGVWRRVEVPACA